MTPTNYTPEMRAADARLHKAIYGEWDETRCRVCGWPVKEMIRDGCTKDICSMVDREDKPRADEPRHFHTSEDARRSLLEWLYRPDNTAVCLAFSRIIYKMAMEAIEAGTVDSMEEFCFLATPDQVARAADKVIREGNK